MTALAVVRNIDSPRALRTTEDAEDFEQEIVDQYALAMAAAGLSDGHVAHTRSVIVEFARSLDGPLWSASCEDADRFLAEQRRAGHTVSTRAGKAGVLALFYEFVIGRYQGDIHALTRRRGRAADRRVQPPAGRVAGEGAGAAVRRGDRGAVRRLARLWCRRRASTCRPRGTTSPRRCGAGWGCGSTRR